MMIELTIILSLCLMLFDLLFISFVNQGKQVYGIKKLIFTIASLALWLVFEIVKLTTNDAVIYQKSLTFSLVAASYVCWLAAMTFYEFAKMKKIASKLFNILVLPLFFLTLFALIPDLNFLILTYKGATLSPFYMSSYQYSPFFITLETFSYLCGVICMYQFYLMEKKSSASFKLSYWVIIILVSIGGAQYFAILHGLYPSVLNISPIIFPFCFAAMFSILNSYTYNTLKNPIIEHITDEIGNLIIAFDSRNTLFFVNNTLINLFNPDRISKTKLTGLNLLNEKKCCRYFPKSFYQTLINNNQDIFEYQEKKYKKTKTIIYDPDSHQRITILNFNDMTTEINHNEKLSHISNTDPLTGLKNRFAFEYDITQFDFAAQQDIIFIAIDLDNLKLTNDIFGHNEGDDHITTLARLFIEIFDHNHVYRIGGDEFYIFILNETIEKAKEKINLLYEKATLFKSNGNVQLQFSTGCTNKGEYFDTFSELIKFADALVYQSKENGKNQATYYTPKQHDLYLQKEQLQKDFIRGVNENEITFFLQPKYNIATQTFDSAEALVRWDHHDAGILSPFKFLDIATSLNMISEMDFIVLEKCCQTLSRWKNLYQKTVKISFNLSLESLIKPTLYDDILKIVDYYQIDHALITFEILEDKKIGDFSNIQSILMGLKNEGFRFSIDDFGSGFSNFDTLENLLVDEIKIDKSLIDHIAVDEKHKRNVAMICDMLSAYHCKIVAEGVETAEQFAVLEHIGIHYIQGYYFSKPISEQDFEARYIAKSDELI